MLPILRLGGSEALDSKTVVVMRVQPDPHPEPGWELDCGVVAPDGGVIRTSWNTPFTGSERTTNAGELGGLPSAQLGRQLFTVKVPLPDPLLAPQDDHVTLEMDMCPSQPMSILVGRT